jgi:predicted double-glycine peptidase
MARAAVLVAFAAPAWPVAGQAMFNVAGDSASVRVTSLRDMPFRTVVRQQYDYSCGSAAVATLLTHHYGRPTAEAAIFEAMYRSGDQEKIRKVGFSLLDMKRYLETQGLKADGYRWTLADLAKAQAPAIALINVGAYRHFVIIKGVRHGKVMVGDPAQGLKLYPLKAFGQVWNGVVFLVNAKAGPQGAYDRAEEWAHLGLGPVPALDDSTLSSFTRELPPIFQIVGLTRGGGSVR